MIALPERLAAEILAHGREAYPEECCGALLGTALGASVRVTRLERTANSQGEARRRRFQISPEEYRRVERLAEAENLTLLGFYHSHPDHPALPSEYDREHALPFLYYVVLAVHSGLPGELTAWVLSEDREVFDQEAIFSEEMRE